jgi:hypothetical protein
LVQYFYLGPILANFSLLLGFLLLSIVADVRIGSRRAIEFDDSGVDSKLRYVDDAEGFAKRAIMM